MLDETSAVFGRKRSVERRDNAGGQGPIETKRISDRKDFLTNTQVVTRADRDGSNTLRKLHAEHGQVVCRAHAHERGTQVTAVIQANSGVRRPGDDVVVGHNVSCIVPDEPRPCSTWNAEHVSGPRIKDAVARADIDDGPARFLKQVDGGLFFGPELAARRYGSGGGSASGSLALNRNDGCEEEARRNNGDHETQKPSGCPSQRSHRHFSS